MAHVPHGSCAEGPCTEALASFLTVLGPGRCGGYKAPRQGRQVVWEAAAVPKHLLCGSPCPSEPAWALAPASSQP